MKLFTIGVLTLALIATSKAYPLDNSENVALDTAHEAHLSAVGGVEKPPESDVVPLEMVKSTEAELLAKEKELEQPESVVELKEEPAVVAEALAPAPEVAEVLAAASEPVAAVLPDPNLSVVAVIEEPAKLEAVAGDRAGRAYGYPFNNVPGYGAWASDVRYNRNGGYLYGSYFPSNYRYPGYYAPGYYWG